jgi:hypothetical protein
LPHCESSFGVPVFLLSVGLKITCRDRKMVGDAFR